MIELSTFLDVLIGCLKTNEAFKLHSFILSQQINGITSIYSNGFILLVYPKGSVSVHRRVCAAGGGMPPEQPRAGGYGRTGRARLRTIVLSFIYQNTFIKQIFLMDMIPVFSRSQFFCKFFVNNSFSTAISSPNFFDKSISLPF